MLAKAFFTKMGELKFRLALLLGVAAVIAAPAAADVINWSNVTDILDGLVGLFPSILNLVLAVFPIIIVISIVGFVVSFLDKILAMLKV
jgi:hypothetical protein